MGEPKYGYKNLIKSTKESKVKGFFNLLIPTEHAGTIELSGFKIISGSSGPFISLPNRAVTTQVRSVVDTETGEVSTAVNGVKYYNNIRFENKEKDNEFKKELQDNVLPMIVAELARK